MSKIIISIFLVCFSLNSWAQSSSKTINKESLLQKCPGLTTIDEVKDKFILLGLLVKENGNNWIISGETNILESIFPTVQPEVIYKLNDPIKLIEINGNEIIAYNKSSAKALAQKYNSNVNGIKSCKIDWHTNKFVLEIYIAAQEQELLKLFEADKILFSSLSYEPITIIKPTEAELQKKAQTNN